MEQNTNNWLVWRHCHIGSSDSPAVMGVSPYKTRFQLWEEKIAPNPPENKSSFQMEKGHRLEPKARAAYEFLHDLPVPPCVVEYERMPFVSASLDGYNDEAGVVVEIKYVGLDTWKSIESGHIPEHFWPQIQHQLLVTGAKRTDLVAYNDEIDKITVLPVLPDVEYIRTLAQELKAFWKLVTSGTPPALSDRDYKTVNDPGIKELIKMWHENKVQMDQLAETDKMLRDKIIESAPHVRLKYKDIRIQKQTRAGAIDYKLIPELKDVDLEPYRKAPVDSWRFTVEKPKKPVF